jgi:hypothetical protein
MEMADERIWAHSSDHDENSGQPNQEIGNGDLFWVRLTCTSCARKVCFFRHGLMFSTKSVEPDGPTKFRVRFVLNKTFRAESELCSKLRDEKWNVFL